MIRNAGGVRGVGDLSSSHSDGVSYHRDENYRHECYPYEAGVIKIMRVKKFTKKKASPWKVGLTKDREAFI